MLKPNAPQLGAATAQMMIFSSALRSHPDIVIG
jgi:hypothetical protein